MYIIHENLRLIQSIKGSNIQPNIKYIFYVMFHNTLLIQRYDNNNNIA